MTELKPYLQVEIERLCRRLGMPQEAKALWDKLQQGYGSEGRYYHNIIHIEEMVNFITTYWRPPMKESRYHSQMDQDAVIMAALWHDFIYDPKAPSGENESKTVDAFYGYAGIMERYFAMRNDQVWRNWKHRVADLILMTQHHEVARGEAFGNPIDYGMGILADADLARWADPWPQFRKNNDDIRKEYAHVPEDQYLAGRTAVLVKYLARDPQYYIAKDLCQRATDNLVREIRELERTKRAL